MKANIIHCDNQPNRLPILLKELEQQGIADYELWDGVFDVTSVKKSINLSHKQIVEYAMLSEWDDVLIMEDDIRFCGEGAFNYYLENKPKEFDIYLGGIYLGEIDENNKTKRFTGLHCYIVAQQFYEKFLLTPTDEHIDRSLDNMGEFYVCNPFTSVQYNGFSSNSKRIENYDHLFQNRKLYNNFSL